MEVGDSQLGIKATHSNDIELFLAPEPFGIEARCSLLQPLPTQLFTGKAWDHLQSVTNTDFRNRSLYEYREGFEA